MSERLPLPQVTLLAVTSVNLPATIAAIDASRRQIAFGACKLLTDAQVVAPHPEVEVVPIAPLTSSRAYSAFMLQQLADHVTTPFCLVVQWDGHVLDPGRWRPEFLDHDYVGASWPQFHDGFDVGNGGFSLRSRRLLEACRADQFVPRHPEDVAIGRTNRAWLEAQGLRFASRPLADLFAAERAGNPAASFGYHGAWLMPRVLGSARFWQLYTTLDERGSMVRDRGMIARQLARGPDGLRRAARMLLDLATRKR
ncbi:DUF5672 family protein [Croceibacterium sp. TMG7-5b_MA50]|uniref:DUF5672 family protein n=1 Tax=Croceibacterium sp. TMG7-5b_MA50 TaxID=3121290 RepID=UPI0032221C76